MAATSETEYLRPQTREEARDLLAEYGADATVAGGGQSLMLMLRLDLVDTDRIVDISSVPAYSGVTEDDGTVTIGATTTYAELKAGAAEGCPQLDDAASVIADEQVRNMGTVGGAISHADPYLDVVPPLFTLDARVHVWSPDGERTVDLADFLHGHMVTDLEKGELVEGIAFDRSAANPGAAYDKRAKIKGGWGTVGVGVNVAVDDGVFADAAVALSGAHETAIRSPAAEDALVGAVVSDETVDAAADAVTDDIDPVSDLSGSRTYKERLASVYTRRTLHTALERAGEGL